MFKLITKGEVSSQRYMPFLPLVIDVKNGRVSSIIMNRYLSKMFCHFSLVAMKIIGRKSIAFKNWLDIFER